MFERERPCHLKVLKISELLMGVVENWIYIISCLKFICYCIFFSIYYLEILKVLFFFSWATLIGFSRIYLGVHYPFDILGGMFWGLFVSLLVYLTYNMKIKKIDKIWIGWFHLVCIWNFGWSKAPAFADVIIAIILSIGVIKLKKTTK